MTQSEYLEILLSDCGFDTRAKRNDFLTLRVGRTVKFLDDMNSYEKHQMIELLKERKQAAMIAGVEDDFDPRDDYRK
jgi:hypothetical protein